MISAPACDALRRALGERIQFDQPVSRHVALRIGGKADAIATPDDVGELSELLRVCAEHSLPTLALGGGFNTLALDEGVEWVVIRTARLRKIGLEQGGRVRAEAGVSHRQLTNFCIEHGLTGLEFAAGIPGTVGGWIAMNAGVPGREMVDVVFDVEVVAPPDGLLRLEASRLEFRYRELRGLPAGSVIAAASFSLAASESDAVRAGVDRLLEKRAQSQPLDLPSCGSVFKNPEGDYAGRLIEAAGLKGARAGGAQITELHANFIANTGGATAADVLALIRRAQEAVLEQSGVPLTPEVRIVGRGA